MIFRCVVNHNHYYLKIQENLSKLKLYFFLNNYKASLGFTTLPIDSQTTASDDCRRKVSRVLKNPPCIARGLTGTWGNLKILPECLIDPIWCNILTKLYEFISRRGPSI